MMKRAPVILGVLFGFVIGSGFGYVYGLVKGEYEARHHVYLTQRQRIEAVLATDPAYTGVEIAEASRGHAYLTGRVSSDEVHRRLRGEMARLFGEQLAETLVYAVVVKGVD